MPSLDDYLSAYSQTVRARRTAADVHRGSRYDLLGGVAAVLFTRVSTRDRDAFRATYFDTGQDTELDELAAKRFGDVPSRVLATKGQGTANLRRPNAVAGAGTILAGTRIAVIQDGAAPATFLEVAQDTLVGATALDANLVPVQRVEAGASTALSLTAQEVLQLRIDDPLWDNTWQVLSVSCASGTERERDADYRARIKAARTDARLGYPKRITLAMTNAGATRVALFASDYLGSAADNGLNRICVGDTSYQSSPDLLLACRLATYDVCVLGTAAQVIPMTRQALSINVVVELWDFMDHVARDLLEADVASSLLNYFSGRQNPFVWRTDAMEGIALKATRQQAQSVTITPSDPEPTLATLFDSIPLVAWSLDPRQITISFA